MSTNLPELVFRALSNQKRLARAVHAAAESIAGGSGGANVDGEDARGMAYALKFGDTYVWTDDMANVAAHLATSTPTDWTFHRDLLQTRMGFAYFEKPLTLAGRELHALVWAAGEFEPSRKGPEDASISRILQPHEEWPPAGRCTCMAWMLLDHNALYFMAFHEGHTPEWDGQGNIAFVASALELLSQRITSRERLLPTRAARRAVEDWRPDPVVNIIRLRRHHSAASSEGEGDAPDWSHRWWVMPHWRHYRDGRSVPVIGYVKGPEDKPLIMKPGAYGVIR